MHNLGTRGAQHRGILRIKKQDTLYSVSCFLANNPNCDTNEPPLALGGSFCAKGVHKNAWEIYRLFLLVR